MISVDTLSKRFGAVQAVDNLSFEIEDGELFALLGANGAGKSTTIACMTTTLRPDSGHIRINNYSVGADQESIRRDTGIVFQQSLLDPKLTVSENLHLKASLYRIAHDRVDDVCDLVGVSDLQRRFYGHLSGGQKRRVDIARALLHHPSVMFLDEPTSGLDPQSRAQVWDAINRLREEDQMTVVLTTHYMEETEEADHVVVVDHGQLVTEGTPTQLRNEFSAPVLRLTPASDFDAYQLEIMLERTRPDLWWQENGSYRVEVRNAQDAIRVLDVYRPTLADFEFVHGSMDDVFLNLLGGEPEYAD
ncbi:MAG: ABC transporter ATP-binding protein [Propionibacteriaceae bacterium]|nr:ABC transporter ATP-binding protein [Propionibacteriaceae bacterium]